LARHTHNLRPNGKIQKINIPPNVYNFLKKINVLPISYFITSIKWYQSPNLGDMGEVVKKMA